ncbi:MAG: 50S ribosomal protein L13 [Oscillospiraceae bacterium]|nr:50S ribosomal protein L13 [Oscillospiraceae bacterium]
MSTFMEKPQNVQRKWYVIDAAGKSLGRTATTVATLLRGKHKVTYTPHVDCGDFVIVVNAEKAVLTGNKLTQKYHRTHSGYPGGLHETRYKHIMETKPEFAMRLAVKGMLGKNSLGRKQISRLKLFQGAEHSHAAQKPEIYAGEVK